ncbi:MAG: hypothetical protein WA790_08970 [Sulfitobacter sp.]
MKTIAIMAVIAMAGTQATAQSLVGKWDCDTRNGPGTAVRTLMDYRENGQFYHHANVASGDRRGRVDAAIVMRGSWSLQGNRVVEKIRTARMRSISANGKDISKTPLGRLIAKTLPRQLGVGKRASVTRIKFLSQNKYRINGKKVTGICTKR